MAPVIATINSQAAAAPDYTPNMLPIQNMPRGCTTAEEFLQSQGCTTAEEFLQRSILLSSAPPGLPPPSPLLSPPSSLVPPPSFLLPPPSFVPPPGLSAVSKTVEGIPPQKGSRSPESFEIAPSIDLDDSAKKQDRFVKKTCFEVRMELPKLARNCSTPSIVQSCPFKFKTMMELHDSGNCRPCAYLYRPTGCHLGDACMFCHLCDPKQLSEACNAKKALTKARLLKARKTFKARKNLQFAYQ